MLDYGECYWFNVEYISDYFQAHIVLISCKILKISILVPFNLKFKWDWSDWILLLNRDKFLTYIQSIMVEIL
jgi:hypothetical protein